VVASWVAIAFFSSLLGSKFGGEWLKATGPSWMPESMKVTVSKNQLTETFFPSIGYGLETIRLVVDGKQHTWTQREAPLDLSTKTYTAQLTKDTFVLTTRSKYVDHPGEFFETEQWSLEDGGKDLVISNHNGQAVYRRASWFRSFFMTNEP